MRIAGLVPALDCASSIQEVVRGALQHLDTVMVVDDGSSDATAKLAADAGALVVSHRRNMGKGAALESGFRALSDLQFTHALTLDGDGQHLADQVPRLVSACSADQFALILGDRCLETVDAAARLNRFGNRFANRWVEIASGLSLPDTQSGFRVYPLESTLALGLRARHFAFETEVIVRAARAGIRIVSVPVKVYYPAPEERVTHFRKFVDTVRIIGVVVALILRIW
ncbi:MAG TPA: glycosyltransferase family 2 protein [Candidatus Acidoferrales bacterium]|nr:glycosyltransferase family 2 protein [Candidatus Acidoferrales bacterium]